MVTHHRVRELETHWASIFKQAQPALYITIVVMQGFLCCTQCTNKPGVLWRYFAWQARHLNNTPGLLVHCVQQRTGCETLRRSSNYYGGFQL